MKNPRNEHNKKVSRAIKLAMSSLDSHVDYCYGAPYKRTETTSFQVKCVQEYAELIFILSSLYRKK